MYDAGDPDEAPGAASDDLQIDDFAIACRAISANVLDENIAR
jgi:hypothetical protein